jgi:hypothetical protein
MIAARRPPAQGEAMAADTDHLEALAALLAGGAAPADALAVLQRAGGAPGAWARAVAAAAPADDLGAALAQTGAFGPADLRSLGDARRAGTAEGLRGVVARRRRQAERGRTLSGALLLPGLLVLTSAVAVRLVGAIFFGGGLGAMVVDVLPFGLAIGAALLLRAEPAAWWARVPGLRRLHFADAEATLAEAVAAGAPQDAFAAASGEDPLGRAAAGTVARLRQGVPLAEALPRPPLVSDGLALALHTATALGEPERLQAFAARRRAEGDRARVRAVRALAWGAVVFATLRSLGAVGDVQLGGVLDPLGGQLEGGDAEELMKLLEGGGL